MAHARVAGLVAVAALALAFAAPAGAAVPNPNARAFYILNATTGEVLASRRANDAVPIASITKLMTVIVALEHLRPDEVVTVTRRAAQVGESSIPLTPGQRISVRDLLKGALIQSANNAADALAAAAADGDVARFVSWMNAKARALGLRHTTFRRPDGLDAPGHLSSARDVAVLAQVAMRSALIRSIVKRRTDTIEGGRFTVTTWNDLLGVFPGLFGVKTGHTSKAGWCEVAAVRRAGDTIYAVILGSPTRAQRNDDLNGMLAWAASQYRTLTLVRKISYASAAVGYGRGSVELVASRSLVRVVRTGRPLVERIVAPAALPLPVRRGERAGRIEIWEGKKLVGSRPLVAARTVRKPGLGARLRWYSARTVHHLGGLLP